MHKNFNTTSIMIDKILYYKKKQKTFLICIIIFTSILTSCEDSDETYSFKSLEYESLTDRDSTFINFRALYSNNHTLSWEEAVIYAEEAAKLCFNNKANVRSYQKQRRVIGGKTLIKKGGSLKSSFNSQILPDTLAYVCNFADSMGYAIICADDRVGCPLLACVDNGILTDTIDNPGLSIFLEKVQDFIEISISNFEEKKDSLKSVAKEMLQVNFQKDKKSLKMTYKGSFTLKKTTEVKPLLTTTWGQSSDPYNTFTMVCPSQASFHAPAGCWATAIAQIMAYYKYPTSINYSTNQRNTRSPYTLNWNGILSSKNASNLTNNTFKTQVSHLLYGIGVNINMNYECDQSGANDQTALAYMKRIGFSGCNTKDYSFTSVKEQLDCMRPVIMGGYTDQTNRFLGIKYSYSGGHTWIVDGYSTTIIQDYYYIVDPDEDKILYCHAINTTYNNPLLHINWGWTGSGDGYFAAGCFDNWNAYSYDSSIPKNHYNFKYKNEIHIVWR